MRWPTPSARSIRPSRHGNPPERRLRAARARGGAHGIARTSPALASLGVGHDCSYVRTARSATSRFIAALCGAWLTMWLAVPSLLVPCTMPDMAGMRMAGGMAGQMPAAALPDGVGGPRDHPRRGPAPDDHAPRSHQCTCPCCVTPVAVAAAGTVVAIPVAVVRGTVSGWDADRPLARRSHAGHFATAPPASRPLAVA